MRLPFLRAKPEADTASPARARSERARSAPPEAASADAGLWQIALSAGLLRAV
jgi:DedD protein